MKLTNKIMLLAAGLALVSACSSEMSEDEQAIYDARKAEEDAKPKNMAAIANDIPELSTFDTALGVSGIAAEEKSEGQRGQHAVFAPSNDAFDKIESDEFSALMTPEKKGELAELMKYHVVMQNMTAAEFAKAITDGGGSVALDTVQGSTIKASMDGDKIVLEDSSGNKANVVRADLESEDGYLHIIDGVLKP